LFSKQLVQMLPSSVCTRHFLRLCTHLPQVVHLTCMRPITVLQVWQVVWSLMKFPTCSSAAVAARVAAPSPSSVGMFRACANGGL
jgi:hypothetical protein